MLARFGAEPLTLVISSVPMTTSFLPGLSGMGTTTRVWRLVERAWTTVSASATGVLPGLKASKRKRAKGFQFLLGPAARAPKLSPAAKATLSALPPPSSLNSSTISGFVLSSMPVSGGTCPLPTLRRMTSQPAGHPGNAVGHGQGRQRGKRGRSDGDMLYSVGLNLRARPIMIGRGALRKDSL